MLLLEILWPAGHKQEIVVFLKHSQELRCRKEICKTLPGSNIQAIYEYSGHAEGSCWTGKYQEDGNAREAETPVEQAHAEEGRQEKSWGGIQTPQLGASQRLGNGPQGAWTSRLFLT